MDAELVGGTLSKIRSECELCGSWSAFTGKTADRDGDTYAVVSCPRGHGEFTVWNADVVSLLAAYERARTNLRDADAYQRAFETLTGGDEAAVAALIASPPPELPLFGIEDVAVPAASASRWSELVLDWDGWRPRPERNVRLDEALATAVKYQSAPTVAAIGAWAKGDEVSTALARLKGRLHRRDQSVLAPLLRA